MTLLAELPIKEIKEKYNLTSFVETGCYRCASLEIAKAAGFEKISSCDIAPEYVALCQSEFPEADIYNLSSPEFLRKVCPTLPPSLFWLDAHYPQHYGIEDTEQTKFPLPEELRIIQSTRDCSKDIIICDDMQVINDPDNPCFRSEYGDIMPDSYYSQNIKIQDLVTPFLSTHRYRILKTSSGVLFFSPLNFEDGTI